MKVARNAEEALRILLGVGSISVVLTDMHSETSNGMELARHIKAQWPDVTLIVTSGWLLPLPGLLPEGTMFLAKPFGQKRLAAILAEAAAGESGLSIQTASLGAGGSTSRRWRSKLKPADAT